MPLFLHLVPTCHMHISTPSRHPLVTSGMFERCHAQVVDDQAPTWSEIITRESQAYPSKYISMPLFLHLVPTCHMHISTPSRHPLVTSGMFERCHAQVVDDQAPTWSEIITRESQAYPSKYISMPLFLHLVPTCHMHISTPSRHPLVTSGMFERCHAQVVDDQAPTWSEIVTRESQAYPSKYISMPLFLHLVPTCHMHISTPSRHPLVTSGMFERCHAQVVDDQAPTWSEIVTRESQAYPSKCISMPLFLHLVPTCHMHISTPSRHPLVTSGMFERCHAQVVDDQAPTWSEIITRESQAYPSKYISMPLFLHLVPTCHMHISTPSRHPLVTSGMFERCHAQVVDDQAPTWSEIITRESQAYPSKCISMPLFLHLVPTCHMHISTPSRHPLVTSGMFERCHAQVVDDQAPTWSEIITRESQAYPSKYISMPLFLHLVPTCHMHISTPSRHPLVTSGMFERCHAQVVDDQAPTWSEIVTRESQAYPSSGGRPSTNLVRNHHTRVPSIPLKVHLNYKHHVNFMAQSKIHPAEILEELTTDIPEIKRILFALATVDLFLSNRAPDLYTNSEALTVLLNQEATRLPDTNCLTDWSLFALIENFSDNLEKFTLPAPVLSAISMLKSITNNYHIDELCSKAHHFMNADEIDPLDLEDDQL
ncbi:hypothetical protein Ae201684P_002603 [Aphanomyces euteiches]|nr:hypothetical protein Ae201684P_002603 [Aphanomyces euteiches]